MIIWEYNEEQECKIKYRTDSHYMKRRYLEPVK